MSTPLHLRTAVNPRHFCRVCEDRPLREPWELLSAVCDACYAVPLTAGEQRLLRDIQNAPDDPAPFGDEDEEPTTPAPLPVRVPIDFDGEPTGGMFVGALAALAVEVLLVFLFLRYA